MSPKIYGTSAGYVSPNALGYVDLPKEAVLNNTVSPLEQRAFAAIAAMPLFIPAALFAPEVALLASLAALTGCGSPGDAEDPTQIMWGETRNNDISPDGGTTDNGDAPVTIDTVIADSGDALVAADDGGMSTPDDGMTLADTEDATIDSNEVDAFATADDGVETDIPEIIDSSVETDSSDIPSETTTIKDVPAEVDSGDILVATDDGSVAPEEITPLDIAPDTAPEVIQPLDVVQDTTSEVIQPLDVVQDTTPEIIQPLDVAPDGSTDADTTDTGTDVAAETVAPCVPSCVPVANTVTCEEGSANVAVSYFVKCATQFVCDGIDNAKVSINLPDANTQTTQAVSVNQCTSNIFFGACQAVNAQNSLSESCEPVTIKATPKPKPNFAPTITQLLTPADKTLGLLPGGNQCFSGPNTIDFTFTAADKDKDPLTCALKLYQNDKLVPAATVSATFGDLTKSLMLQLPSNLLQPRTDYCWNVSCADGKGDVAVAGANSCFTTSEKGLIGWWRFDEGQGNVAKDSSGNAVDGTLTDFDLTTAWVKTPTGGGLFFDGMKNYIQTNSPASWNTLEKLTVEVSFSNAFPLDENAVLIDKIGKDSNRWALEFYTNKTLLFGSCASDVVCALGNVPQTTILFSNNDWHTVIGIYSGTQASIFVDGILDNQVSYVPFGGTLATSTDFLIGRWNSGGRFYHGTVDNVAIYNVDTTSTCK